jgi:hydrogenase maturation protease
MNPRILIAGIGNIFLGDDAFGVEVAQRLLRRPQPEDVRVVDFGIRGLDLTYALLDGNYEVAILIDATPRGGPPGTLYILEPEIDPQIDANGASPLVEGHSMDPVKVLRTVAAMGGGSTRVLLVGCEPGPPLAEDEMDMSMSEPVQAAAEEAVGLVESLVARILKGEQLSESDTAPSHLHVTAPS